MTGSELSPDLLRDVAAIGRLPAVPTILRVISEITGLRFTLVARVTEERWIACAVHDEISFGLEAGGTLDLSTTLCKQVRDTRAPVVINHASTDPVYCSHPTPKLYGFESYISWPLYDSRGEYFGTLCGLDPRPALVDDAKVLEMFKHFSELITLQLASEERLRATSEQLLDAQHVAQLREQFVAVLSHDLRNPLASMSMAAESLLNRSLDERTREVVKRMQRSARRMTEMVTNLLDFARAKLGDGIGITTAEVSNLDGALRQVISELQTAYPTRHLSALIEPTGTLRCDSARLAQLLSNLVANALQHGGPEAAVKVHVQRREDALVIAVHNEGEPIPPEMQAHLFEPYTRGGARSAKGLGLGLYIVKQIADAHGATIAVDSQAAAGTTFTFTMPLSGVCS